MSHLEETLKRAEESRRRVGQTSAGVPNNFVYMFYFLVISGVAIWIVIVAKGLDFMLKTLT